MTFQAKIVRVLVASPGDTSDERRVLREVIYEWNEVFAERGVVFQPLMWERNSVPEMGERPQGIINRQLVDRCDMLIGLFWTRLGSPTGEGESGTAEEIDRCVEGGKPVLVYFSDRPVAPESIDLEEYQRLKNFKAALKSKGLIDSYSTPEELAQKVHRALAHHASVTFGGEDTKPEATAIDEGASARLLVEVEGEREFTGVSKTGTPRYTTRRRLLVRNVGSGAAEDLELDMEAANAQPEQLPKLFTYEGPVNRLAPGGVLTYGMAVHMGTVAQCDVVLSWKEKGVSKSETQTIRIF